MDEWKTVERPKRVNKGIPERKVSQEEVINELSKLEVYNPVGVFLFGSVARDAHRVSSDVDVLVIWKKQVPSNIHQIKRDLMNVLGKRNDLVCMIMGSKEAKSDYFIENIMLEAITVIGDLNDVLNSELVGKV